VYKAQDTKLDRIIALKFLPHHLTPNDDDKARFLQEAKAASVLSHPNVCTIFDCDRCVHHGLRYFVLGRGTSALPRAQLRFIDATVQQWASCRRTHLLAHPRVLPFLDSCRSVDILDLSRVCPDHQLRRTHTGRVIGRGIRRRLRAKVKEECL
jgi:serine/threonine protein kinase